jgi:epoxyqueuosine reductase
MKRIRKDYLSVKIRNLAISMGIDVLGFAEASEFSGYPLKNSKRRNPKLSLPDAKTIIVAGIYIGAVTLPKWASPWYGQTSRLYLSEFFLDVVKPLKPIAEFIKNKGYQAKICDSSTEEGSILPLKLAAVRAGLGWQGKNSLLISRKYGTFLALGGIITSADLEHNFKEEPNQCRKCDKCQEACPLDALEQPYKLNRKQCMSNSLQNEDLPDKVNDVMENRIIDCEICQHACPWNKKHIDNPMVTHMTESFQNKIEDWDNFFYLPDVANLNEKEYNEKLSHLKTGIPFSLVHRNVLIALEKAKKIRMT